jgi:hypothetical protein
MEYVTAKEAAQKWGISERRLQVLCKQGKVEGAKRLGWAWAIPQETDKPSDGRSKSMLKFRREGLVNEYKICIPDAAPAH